MHTHACHAWCSAQVQAAASVHSSSFHQKTRFTTSPLQIASFSNTFMMDTTVKVSLKKNKNIFWGSTCSPVTACSSPGLLGSPASSPSTEGGSRQTSAYPRLHPFLSGAQVPLRFCQNADSDAEVPGWGPRLCIPEKLQADGDDVVPGTPSVCPRRLQRTLLL